MNKLNSMWKTAVAAGMGLLPSVAFAANPFETAKNLTSNVATAAEIKSSTDIGAIVGKIVNAALGFLGIVFLVLLLYAGFIWMTAQGDEKKTAKARDMISQAVIGLVIIVAAYAISTFVLSALINVTQ